MADAPRVRRTKSAGPGLGSWDYPQPPGGKRGRVAPIVVHQPLGAGGRPVSVRGEVVGVAQSVADVLTVLRRVGIVLVGEAEQQPGAERRRGRRSVTCHRRTSTPRPTPPQWPASVRPVSRPRPAGAGTGAPEVASRIVEWAASARPAVRGEQEARRAGARDNPRFRRDSISLAALAWSGTGTNQSAGRQWSVNGVGAHPDRRAGLRRADQGASAVVQGRRHDGAVDVT